MLAFPAGKGRSGTLACSYLLTLEEVLTSIRLERSHTRKEGARKRVGNDGSRHIYIQTRYRGCAAQGAGTLAGNSRRSTHYRDHLATERRRRHSAESW